MVKGVARRARVAVLVAPLAFGGMSGALADPLTGEYRSIDGSRNNIAVDGTWGMAETPFLRMFGYNYYDGAGAVPVDPDPANTVSARAVSNAVSAQTGLMPNAKGLSDFVWQWGQFLDHDITLTQTDPTQPFNIPVPTGDPQFDTGNTGTQVIPLSRSVAVSGTGTTATPREQANSITAYIDASNVYGSDAATQNALRTGSGGRLATSAGDLLPLVSTPQGTMFMAGDERANEQSALTAMHTLFVREHNRLAADIDANDTTLSSDPTTRDQQIFDKARRIVGAELQSITYNEFLPALLGTGALTPYTGYKNDVNATITNEFATAGYRFGHSMLSSELLRLNEDGTVAANGNLPLKDAFFTPSNILTDPQGIDSLLRGLAAQGANEVDTRMVDDVRNMLFGPPGSGGFDLAALNIQRGRDHGLVSYNDAREALGLGRIDRFDNIVFDPGIQAKLVTAYGDLFNVDDLDLWVGILAEASIGDSMLGEVGMAILIDQFTRLRDGDRFFYLNDFGGDELTMIESTTLADIIRHNTGIDWIQDNVFYAEDRASERLAALPAPGGLVLFSLGLAGLALIRRKRMR